MQLHQVEVVGFHALEAALDAVLDGTRSPWLAVVTACDVACLCRQDILVAPVRDRPPDQLLAVAIAGRCIEKVDPSVERCVEQFAGDRFLIQGQVSHLCQTCAEPADAQARSAEGVHLHL